MTYVYTWLFLSIGGLAGHLVGLTNSVDTIAAQSYFGGLALLLHWLYVGKGRP